MSLTNKPSHHNLRALKRTLLTGLLILIAPFSLERCGNLPASALAPVGPRQTTTGLLGSEHGTTSPGAQSLHSRHSPRMTGLEQFDANEPQIEFEHISPGDLGDLLRQLADAFVGRTGANITVSADDHHALASEARIALYRIAQEDLNNIVKHAKASHVELSLNRATAPPEVDRKTPHRVELRVSDDGRGFDPTNVQPGHHGLSIIRERSSAIGANLTVESQADQGTEIVVMWEERQ